MAELSGLTITDGIAGGSSPGGGLVNLGHTTLNNCTITGNEAPGGHGGGVYNNGSAILTLNKCTISGNSAKYGGGLDNNGDGNLTLNDCTISANSAADHGGGLDNGPTATLTLNDCTISGNSANVLGGGLDSYGSMGLTACTISTNYSGGLGGGLASSGTANLVDTIVAGNTKPTGASDIHNTGTLSGSYDLIGTGGSGGLTSGTGHNVVLSSLASLGLAPLGAYGGPTQTMALLPGSAALGTGANENGFTTDQRGMPLATPAPDIGAYQSQGFTLSVWSKSTPQSAAIGTSFTVALTVTVTAKDPNVPLAFALVSFAAPSSGASATLSSSSAPISESGVADVVATANAKAGSYTVVASIPGTTATADFELTNVVPKKAATQVVLTPVPSFNKKHKLVSLKLEAQVERLIEGGSAPTGKVEFEVLQPNNKVHTIGTSSIHAGKALLIVKKPSAVLNKSITVIYEASGDFLPSSSPPTSINSSDLS